MYYNNNDQVRQTLAALNALIIKAERGQITSYEIKTQVEQLAHTGLLKIVGQGMNRIAVEVNGDVSQYIKFPGQAIFKIPFSTVKGIDDNIRELSFVNTMKYLSQQSYGNIATAYTRLANILPAVSEVIGFPALIAQEKVIPIEKSQEVLNKTQYTEDKKVIARISSELILTKYKTEFEQLMADLKETSIFADLNPMATPSQYGLVNRNGVLKLTILDTGYVIPLLPELKQRIDQEGLTARAIIPGVDFSFSEIPNSEDKRLAPRASDINMTLLAKMNVLLPYHGVYLYTGQANKHDIGKQLAKDMDYFMNCYAILGEIARLYPTSISGRYFISLNQMKLFN